jgi:hypothetical protein
MKDLAFHLMHLCGSLKEGRFTGTTHFFEEKQNLKDPDLSNYSEDSEDEDMGIDDPDESFEEDDLSGDFDDSLEDEGDFSSDPLEDSPMEEAPEEAPTLDDASGIPDKLYLGANSNGDKNFYAVTVLNDTGNLISDIVLQDQNEVPIMKASENNIPVADFPTALLKILQLASDEYGMTNLSYDVHSKWILPKIMELQAEAQRNVAEEEVSAEEEQIQKDLEQIESPEDLEAGTDEEPVDEFSDDFELEEEDEEDKKFK